MKKDSKLAQFFQEKGEKKSIRSMPPLELNQRCLFYVASGDLVNIFAFSQEAPNKRYFVASASEGDVIFFFPQNLEPFSKIVAYSENLTELISLNETQIKLLVQSDCFYQNELAHELERWANELFMPFSIDPFQRKYHYPEDQQQLEVSNNEIISRKVTHEKNVSMGWLEIQEGELLLLSRGEKKLNASSQPIILTQKIWYKTETPCKLRIIDFVQFFQKYDFFAALDQFTSQYLNQLQIAAQIEKQEKLEISVARNREEKLSLSFALEKIQKFFSKPEEKAFRKRDDLICNALERLSMFLDFNFTFPTLIEKVEDKIKKLRKICHTSGVHFRRIKLSDNWWTKDNGPLLAFLKNEEKPVILVRAFSDHYTLIDEDKKEKVSQALAENLSSSAYMFYIPFKEQFETGKSLLKQSYHKFKKVIFSIVGFSFLGSLVILLIPLTTRVIFNSAIPKGDITLLVYMILGMLMATIGYALFSFIRAIYITRFGAIASHFLETALWDRVLKLNLGFFRRFTIGNLFWRLFAIEKIRIYFNGPFVGVVLNAAFSFLFIALMFFFSPALAGLTLSFALLCLGITFFFYKRKMRLLINALEINGNVKGFVVQLIINVNKLKAAIAEKSAFAEWCRKYTDYQSIFIKVQNTEAWVGSLSAFFPIVSTLFVYIALIWWIKVINFSLPDFLGFNIAFSSFLVSFYPVNYILMGVAEIAPYWGRLKPILDEKLDGSSSSLIDSSKSYSVSGKIRFDNVTFSYDSNQPPIIKNVSFEVEPNEFLAIVGPSGNGKSTLIRLLLGFEKAQSGAIYYDNQDIDSYDLVLLRQQLGVVFQNEGIMAGSLYTNLVSGGDYSLDEIREAMRISEFEKDFEDMPMGLNTIITMDGTTLSGGQKQRLLLTRALMGNPKILIFDEATSALDNVTQNNVSENLAQLSVTRIVIAQRLSTIKKADRILVLEKGSIVQQGTFKELSEQNGLFQDMVKWQKL